MIDFDSEFKKNWAEFEEKQRIRLEIMRKDKEQRLANRDNMLSSMSLPLAQIRNLMAKKKDLRKKYEDETREINLKMRVIVTVLYKNGIKQKEIAEELGVTSTTVAKMANYYADPE